MIVGKKDRIIVKKKALNSLSPAVREAVLSAQQADEEGDNYPLSALRALKDYPVPIEQFIRDPKYLGSNALYPEVMGALIELNNPKVEGNKYRSRLWVGYTEAILTGGIGVGKSTIAIYSMLYQLYILSCFKSPHDYFDLDPASEIVIVFQNKTERLAKAVDYNYFKELVDQSPYFREQFRYERKVTSELKFPKRIVVKPVSGADTAVIGQNVFCGVIDEVNFMETIEKSSRSHDGRDYDQASALYDSISRRRASRFQKRGHLPGMLCLVSSRRYSGQFTDQREAERTRQLQATGKTSIYLYDRKLWEIKPKGTYSGEMFRVFVGDFARQPRILSPDEKFLANDEPLVIDVPVEHRPEFERDILNALRDIAGVSTQAIHPFLTNREAIAECFTERPSILSLQETTFENPKLELYPARFVRPDLLRFAHLDLSVSGDATGIVVGCVDRFVKIKRGNETEVLPHFQIDFALRVMPPANGEIPYHRIRKLLYMLRSHHMNLLFVTADSFQSVDMLQTLQHKGFKTGQKSMDRTTAPYEHLKSAIYDNRLSMPKHDKLGEELISLEVDEKAQKIDHPPGGSKDLADALAGVVYGLAMRREVWFQHGIVPGEAAPKFRAQARERARLERQ
jgi:hypothetical protein